jgi:hypothetical protein
VSERASSSGPLAALLVAALAVAGLGSPACHLERADASPDRVEPVPAEIPYLGISLPPSAHDYYAYESGLQHTLLQLRFALAPGEVGLLEQRLPCRLGAEQTGTPEQALVGTNDRSWYAAEKVQKHRGCEYHQDLRSAEFLLDLDDPAHVLVYAVISSE